MSGIFSSLKMPWFMFAVVAAMLTVLAGLPATDPRTRTQRTLCKMSFTVRLCKCISIVKRLSGVIASFCLLCRREFIRAISTVSRIPWNSSSSSGRAACFCSSLSVLTSRTNAAALVRLVSTLSEEQKQAARPEELLEFHGILDTVEIARMNSRRHSRQKLAMTPESRFTIEMHLHNLTVKDILQSVRWVRVRGSVAGNPAKTVNIAATTANINHGIFSDEKIPDIMWLSLIHISEPTRPY